MWGVTALRELGKAPLKREHLSLKDKVKFPGRGGEETLHV